MWSILHASWLEQRPHYAEEILFLWLGLQFTLICHKNGAFQKRSSNRRNLKTVAFRFSVDGRHLKYVTFRKRSLNLTNLKALAFCFSVDGKHFKNGAFIKRWHHDNGVISLPEVPSNTNLKWPAGYCYLLNFSMNRTVLNFLRRSVDDNSNNNYFYSLS